MRFTNINNQLKKQNFFYLLILNNYIFYLDRTLPQMNFRDLSYEHIKDIDTYANKKKPMFDEKHQKLLNGVSLVVSKGIGFSQKIIKNNAYALDQTKIAYICGKNIIVYDILAENQKLFHRPKQQQQISAFGCFKTLYSEDYIIYASKGLRKNYPQITTLNIWKNIIKNYVLYNMEKQEIVTDLVFFLQGTHFALLSKYQKNKRITIFNVDYTQHKYTQLLEFDAIRMFNFDTNSQNIYMYTETQIYLLRYDKISLSYQTLDIQLLETQKIIEVRGMSSNQPLLVIVTDQANLYICKNTLNEGYKFQIQDLGDFETVDSNGNVTFKRKVPTALCCNDYNIIVGYQNLELLTLVKVSGINYKKRVKQEIRFNAPFIHKVINMNFSEENSSLCLVIQLKQQDKYGIDMKLTSQFLRQKGEQITPVKNLSNHLLPAGKIIPVVFNFLLYQTLMQTFRSPMNSLFSQLMFAKPITGLAICPFKKILLIMSSQKKIKAMKYEGINSSAINKLFLWQYQFSQVPIALDMHPSNFHIVFAFRQGIKTYLLNIQGLKFTNFNYNLKHCESVKYSRYGHILAASSNNQIVLINPYSHDLISTIPLHLGSPIKQLQFIDHDRSLFFQSNNGVINIITLAGVRQIQYSNKNMKCLSSFYDHIYDILIISYPESITKFYRQKGTLQFAVMWSFPFNVTSILVCNEFKAIFMGTSMGSIRMYQWPFTDMNKFSKSFTQISLHQSSVTNMRITHDLGYIISSSQDGCVYISKLQHFNDGMLTTDSEIINVIRNHNRDYTMLYNLERYTSCSLIQENLREQKIIQLEADKADFQTQIQESINQKNQEIEEKIQKQQDLKKGMKAKINENYSERIKQILKKKKYVEDELALLIKNTQQTKVTLQQEKTKVLRKLYAQNDKLKEKKAKLVIQFAEKLQIEQKIKKQQFQQLKSDNHKTYLQLLEKCQKTEQDFNFTQKQRKLIEQQEENQQIQYKHRMINQLQQQKAYQNQRGQDLRKRLNRVSTQNVRFEGRKKQLKNITQQIQSQIQQLRVQRKEYQSQIQYIKKLLEQKDLIINQQQKKAKQYLKKNISESNKQIYLTYKMKELDEKKNQMEAHLNSLQVKHNKLYSQFLEEALNKKQVEKKIEESSHKLKQLKQKLKHKINYTIQKKYQYEVFKTKVYDILHNHTEGMDVEFAKLLNQQNGQNPTFQEYQKDIIQEQKLQQLTQKRDMLLINCQKNQKLNDTNDDIKKNILLKVNYETINLTSECNQLRFQKNFLLEKMKVLTEKLKQIKTDFTSQVKIDRQLVDIFPSTLNISKINKKAHTQVSTKLPFQRYQQQSRMKRLNLALSKMKSPKLTQQKISLLKLMKNKQSNSKIHDISKTTKPSFQDPSISFLPPINNKDVSLFSLNQSIVTNENNVRNVTLGQYESQQENQIQKLIERSKCKKSIC